jgi:polysaccharide export outer membrane protein
MKSISFIALFVLALFSMLLAQDQTVYKIGVDDRLAVSFWQETASNLNSTVRVREDGKITLPVIGDIQAADLTTGELAKKIVQQMSFYNPGISQATVVVTEYNSQTVVVTGAVHQPGKLHFERIPNLLDVIREAGGATDSSDLSRVTIVRQENGKARVIEVDILKRLHSGDITDLPPLQNKDMINVPRSLYGLSPELSLGPAYEGKNIYFIYGAVQQPGTKNWSEGIDLVDAISAANGITADADIKNIRVVIKDVQYSSVLEFNLDKYSKKGQPARYKLRPEDTIVIPFRPATPSWVNRLPELIIPGLITTVVTTILVTELNRNAGN